MLIGSTDHLNSELHIYRISYELFTNRLQNWKLVIISKNKYIVYLRLWDVNYRQSQTTIFILVIEHIVKFYLLEQYSTKIYKPLLLLLLSLLLLLVHVYMCVCVYHYIYIEPEQPQTTKTEIEPSSLLRTFGQAWRVLAIQIHSWFLFTLFHVFWSNFSFAKFKILASLAL